MALSYERLKEINQGLIDTMIAEGESKLTCLEHLRKFISIDMEQIKNAEIMLNAMDTYPERFANGYDKEWWENWRKHHVNDLQALNDVIKNESRI